MSAIDIDHVSKRFVLAGYKPRGLKEWMVARLRGHGEPPESALLWALKDVSLAIERGETFGVIGDNGSGKSTLLKLITGISKPTSGSVRVDGRISPLIELGAGFHPDFSGRENVFLNGAILGLKRREIEGLLDQIVAFSELERFIDSPVKTYSSGMYMRLAFAIAIHVDPDILVVDEVLAVGDAAFQSKCLDQIQRFKHAGKTIVLVSHSLSTVREICQRAAWLHQGELRAVGKAEAVLAFYQEQVARKIEAHQRELPSLVPDGRGTLSGLVATDLAGRPRGTFEMNEGARFEFDLATAQDPSSLQLVARVMRSDGICCYDRTLPLDAPGAGRYTLEVPTLALYPSNYVLTLALASGDDWLDEKYFNFSVEGPAHGVGVAPWGVELARLTQTRS